MKIANNIRTGILFLVAGVLICFVFQMSPISQDPSYHHFTDNRTLFAIPNFYNVITNVPFVFLGLLGLHLFVRENTVSRYMLPALCLFIGVTAIGFGSAYYHFNPNNKTLVWDR